VQTLGHNFFVLIYMDYRVDVKFVNLVNLYCKTRQKLKDAFLCIFLLI